MCNCKSSASLIDESKDLVKIRLVTSEILAKFMFDGHVTPDVIFKIYDRIREEELFLIFNRDEENL